MTELTGNVLFVMIPLRIAVEDRNMTVSKLLSVGHVSARLQCARSTVRKLIADGELRASRIGNRTIRVSEADLQAYVDGRANVSPAVPTKKRNGVAR